MRVVPGAMPAWALEAMTFTASASIAWTVAVISLRVAHPTAHTTVVCAGLAAMLVGAGSVWRLRWRTSRAAVPWVSLVFLISAIVGATAGAMTGGVHAAAQGAIWGPASMAPSFVIAGLVVLVTRSAHAARALDTVDAGERLAVSAGVLAAGLSTLGVVVAGTVGLPPLLAAIAMLGLAAWRDARRAGWLARVHDGRVPGWSIIAESEIETRGVVPSVTHGLHDAVLTYAGPTLDPYRAGRPQVIARVPGRRDELVRVPSARSRVAVTVAVGLLVVVGVPLGRSWVTSSHASEIDRGHRRTPLVAPPCKDARAYFAERTRALPGVMLASLVTHSQDPTVSEGSGVIVVARKPGPATATDAEVLDVARAIPCSEKLSLEVEEAHVRTFDVEASFELEPDARPDAVADEAQHTLTELFDLASSTSLAPHITIGADEGAFGWRVRWALKHVPGVAKARVKVDGHTDDVPLGARELPTLGKLTLLDANGSPLP